MYVVKGSDLPRQVIVNFGDYCGWNDDGVTHSQYRLNRATMFESCNCEVLPRVDDIGYYSFESEAGYLMFLLRWG
jgi:hypothetical protein